MQFNFYYAIVTIHAHAFIQKRWSWKDHPLALIFQFFNLIILWNKEKETFKVIKNKFKRKKLKKYFITFTYLLLCVVRVWICECTEARELLVVASSLLSLGRSGLKLGWKFVCFKQSLNIRKLFFCPGCCVFVVRLSFLLAAPNNDTDTY